MGNVPTQNDHDTIQGKERVKVLGSISFDQYWQLYACLSILMKYIDHYPIEGVLPYNPEVFHPPHTNFEKCFLKMFAFVQIICKKRF